MSLNLSSRDHATGPVAGAVWHALAWLVFGNALGVMIAILLLAPGLNAWLGEWTYGRWMMVHMNTALYGWCSMPMLAFLFRVYGAERGQVAAWCRPVLWIWSSALVIGSISWVQGHSSGKLFLDWQGYAGVFFPLAMLALWIVLAVAFVRSKRVGGSTRGARITKAAGLLVLLAVPFAIYIASSPGIYPAINPDTGGPTGESQLESSLGIVLILLMLPFGISRRIAGRGRIIAASWVLLAAEGALCATLSRADISHHSPAQWIALGSIVVWLPIMPAYYRAFAWKPETRRWRTSMLWWWGGLVISGWALFLPGVLDRAKFTDALVGHSLAAVAGFLSALLIFMMVELLGERDAWILNRAWSFHLWNWGVLAYVAVMSVAGWMEARDPAFTIVPGPARDTLYVIRLITGLMMLAASIEWLAAAFRLPALAMQPATQEQGVKVA
jgi:cytochrome c oxidase cbb3-type subunit 1